MIENASGLVLRTRPLTETSLIVQWLTREQGRLSTVAKGARRPKSPFLGKLDLFYLADFSFQRSRRSELHILREVSLLDTHRALREELGWLEQAAYCARLVEQATETETPLPAIFGLMSSLLDALPHQAPLPQTVFAFELKLLGELGLKPNLAASQLFPGTRRLLQALAETEWPRMAQLKPSQAQITESERFLHGFLTFHLGKIPPGRAEAMHAADLLARH